MYLHKNCISLLQTGGFKKYLEPYEYPTIEVDTLSSKSPSDQLSDNVMLGNNEQASLINLTEGIGSTISQFGGSLYGEIINPIDNVPYSILSNKGKNTLYNYLVKYTGGNYTHTNSHKIVEPESHKFHGHKHVIPYINI